jgi:glycosyltransferase involved in cell wall biosynthesis
LLIAGDGDGHGSLQSQIRDCGMAHRIHFLGAKDHGQVASLMRGSLAVIVPSRREPFGIVGLEALASGKPVIASRVGGLVEVLEGADVTWTVPGDTASLAAALADVVRRGPNAGQSLQMNRCRAAEHSWQAVAEQYMSVLV